MPERIPGTNMVKLFENEFVVASDGNRVEGPQTVRIQEYDLDVVQVQGTKSIGPDQTEEIKVEVEASNIDDFMTKVQTSV